MKRKLWFLVFFALLPIAFFYSNCLNLNTGSNSILSSKGTDAGNPYSSVAALPEVYLNSNFPTNLSGKVLTVGASVTRDYSNCQSAIDAANPGDEVAIDPGFVCQPISLHNKGTSSTYIVITTANLAALPPQGSRINRTDSTNMAVIETMNGPAVTTTSGAHHFQLVGLEIRLSPKAKSLNKVLVDLGASATTLADAPNNIVIARSWIHAAPTLEQFYGVFFNGSALSLVDSIIDDIHNHLGAGGGINSWNLGSGPFKLTNNEILTAGAGFVIGASSGTIQNLIPSDIEFRRNFVHKLLAWQSSVASNLGTTGPWAVANLLSLVNVQRILIDGNTFQDAFFTNPPMPGQGFALAITPSSSQFDNLPVGSLPWVRAQDITITNNVFSESAGLLTIRYEDPEFPSVVAQRIDIENNVAYDVGPTWGSLPFISLLQNAQGPTVFNHNTFLLQTASTQPLINDLTQGKINQFTFVNGISYSNNKGFYDSNWGVGAGTLMADFPGISLTTNVLAGEISNQYGNYAYSNFFPQLQSQIGFVSNPTGGVTDFHTLALLPASPYSKKSNDGSDIGANISLIDQAQSKP